MKNVLIFIGGATVGSLVTWKFLEKKYIDLANEEIDSVVERFKEKEKKIKTQVENKKEFNNIVNEEHYTSEEKVVSEEIKNMEDKLINNKTTDIQLIDPNEFGNMPKYDTKSWTFWNNDILTDEVDMIIENSDQIIGDALDHFDDYEDGDGVYVRNNKLKCDYEILKSEKDFDI